jgi:YVTN family beta-propeller protein
MSCGAQSQNQSMKLIATIPLENVSGRIDHLAYDQKGQRLFIAALGNNTIEVVDLKNNEAIHTINGIDEPQGIVYNVNDNSILASSGGNGDCIKYNAESYNETGRIHLKSDADNIRLDSANGLLYVGYGNGGIAIIDPVNFKLISEVKLSAHPESFQVDTAGGKIFVNVPDRWQVEVIDIKKKSVVDRWSLSEAGSNFPMCLDESSHRLYIGCRHASKMLVLNTENGKTIASVNIDNDVDDIFYDNKSNNIYLSCGAGYIDVISKVDSNTFIFKEKIKTKSGARTSLFVPGLNRYFVASPSGKSSAAAILVYEIK